jgi:hypothetical protein
MRFARPMRRAGPTKQRGPSANLPQAAWRTTFPPMIVHVVDGTDELFRRFYRLLAATALDPRAEDELSTLQQESRDFGDDVKRLRVGRQRNAER